MIGQGGIKIQRVVARILMFLDSTALDLTDRAWAAPGDCLARPRADPAFTRSLKSVYNQWVWPKGLQGISTMEIVSANSRSF